MAKVAYLRPEVRTTNFLRAHVGETLTSEEIIAASRRVIVVSAARGMNTDRSNSFARIELPPVRRWEGRELTIVGGQFCISPHDGELLRGGEAMGRNGVRLVPLIAEDGRDGWAILN
jgi:hypothetical protein